MTKRFLSMGLLALMMSAPVAFAAADKCDCGKDCQTECKMHKGDHKNCSCKSCDCSKTGKCSHGGKCEHHEEEHKSEHKEEKKS